jgi:hypothetical protein
MATRLEAKNAQLRCQYHQLINALMQKHPESGSSLASNWRAVVTCREEGQILESQLEDLSKRGSTGLDVMAEVLDQLSHDYRSLLTIYRNVIGEQAVLNDNVKHFKRQFRTFTGSQNYPFPYFAEVSSFASLDTLYLPTSSQDTDETPIVGLDDVRIVSAFRSITIY